MRIGIGIGLNKHRPSGSALDGLALDLQFAADKTLTARRGPTPQFTRASTGTFVGSDGLIQSAAIDAPRFDHDPITLACRGLLIEEGRTNLVVSSVDQTTWSGSGTRTRSAETAPNGTQTATLLTSANQSFSGFARSNLISSTIGVAYTASFFVKKGNWSFVAVDFNPLRNSGNFLPFFNLDTITFNANGNPVTGSIVAYPNGWWRIQISGTALRSTNSGLDLFLVSSGGNGGNNIGAGNTVHSWGAQLEEGAFPTSYIPTTSAEVTRSADVCSISGSDFSGIYNRPACTVVASFVPATIAAPTAICGTKNPRDIEIQMIGGGSIVGLGLDTSLATKQLSRTGVAVGVAQKFAFASESSNQAVCLNNGTVLSALSWVKNASTPTLFHIGRAGFGGQYTGTISSLRIYRTRLSNEKLQALTL